MKKWPWHWMARVQFFTRLPSAQVSPSCQWGAGEVTPALCMLLKKQLQWEPNSFLETREKAWLTFIFCFTIVWTNSEMAKPPWWQNRLLRASAAGAQVGDVAEREWVRQGTWAGVETRKLVRPGYLGLANSCILIDFSFFYYISSFLFPLSSITNLTLLCFLWMSACTER